MNEEKYNGSHKLDITSYTAINAASKQPEKVNDAIAIIKRFLQIVDLELVGRIAIRDKTTGKIWK